MLGAVSLILSETWDDCLSLTDSHSLLCAECSFWLATCTFSTFLGLLDNVGFAVRGAGFEVPLSPVLPSGAMVGFFSLCASSVFLEMDLIDFCDEFSHPDPFSGVSLQNILTFLPSDVSDGFDVIDITDVTGSTKDTKVVDLLLSAFGDVGFAISGFGFVFDDFKVDFFCGEMGIVTDGDLFDAANIIALSVSFEFPEEDSAFVNPLDGTIGLERFLEEDEGREEDILLDDVPIEETAFVGELEDVGDGDVIKDALVAKETFSLDDTMVLPAEEITFVGTVDDIGDLDACGDAVEVMKETFVLVVVLEVNDSFCFDDTVECVIVFEDTVECVTVLDDTADCVTVFDDTVGCVIVFDDTVECVTEFSDTVECVIVFDDTVECVTL